jgi:phosphoribosylanthranilate isomerase
MFVKICGITRQQDAEAAVEAGANALGFVFWPESPRFIDPYRARSIIGTLPPFVTPVGLFVNQPAGYVNGVAGLARLGAVQLHGDESPDAAALISRPIVKAIGFTGSRGEDAACDRWASHVIVLLDAHDPARRGGTGRVVDWAAAARIAARRRTMLAGGLTADNIAEAIARVQPFGVDVSSGVEESPGIKDRARLRALFERIHGITASQTRS